MTLKTVIRRWKFAFRLTFKHLLLTGDNLEVPVSIGYSK